MLQQISAWAERQALKTFPHGFLSRIFTRRAHSSVYERLQHRFTAIRERMDARESLNRDLLIHTKDQSIQDKQRQIARISKDIQDALRDPELKHDLRRAEAHMLRGRYSDRAQHEIQAMLDMHRQETALTPEQAAYKDGLESQRALHSRDKANNDWESAKQRLKDVVGFKRRQAAQLQAKRNAQTPYEALLQTYCPGMREAYVAAHFDQLVPAIKDIMQKAQARQGEQPAPLGSDFDPGQIHAFLQDVITHIGFDRTRGDLYFTHHDPIEGGTHNDARVVIKTLDRDGESFKKAIKSAIHEAAHGLHLQNLPGEEQYSVLGQPPSTDLWEAMALGYEMVLSRSPEFNRFLADKADAYFGAGAVDSDQLFRLRTHVTPGLDRKSADEVSYHLHIAIRFDLERRLINGDLEVEELPDEWNRLYAEHFGQTPETPAEGVLQDVHWWVGKFGYFPAYSLGLMEFAQLNEAMRARNPDTDRDLEKGDFARITQFYKDNVFESGNKMNADELIRRVTNRAFGPDALLRHLHRRYTGEDHAPATRPERQRRAEPA